MNNFDLDRALNPAIKTLLPKHPRHKTKDAICLDKGELPYPPSDLVVEAIAEAAREINHYPDILGGSLRVTLGEYAQVKPEQIVIGNGSDDLIELIVKVFVRPGEEVLLPSPTFFVYEFATQVCGGVPIAVSRTEDFGLNLQEILQGVNAKTKVIFIANPNNPTANLIPRETLSQLLQQVNSKHENCLVVVDECYYEFCQETVVDLIQEYANLIILRSLSKSFGLAGIRVGYALANATLIDYLYRAAQLFPVNKLALVAGNAVLKDLAYVHRNIEKINQEKSHLSATLSQLGLTVYPSSTNFLFVGTKPLGIASQNLVQALQTHHILVADFGFKQGLEGYYFRVSIGTPQQNQIFLDALKTILANLESCP